MRCPNCQRLILNNTARCPYCGQAVSSNQNLQTNQAKDMFAANPMPAPAGIPPVEHHEAMAHEVKKRHWQRWIFYGLIILIILGAVGLIVKIYNDNTTLLLAVTSTKEDLAKASADIKAKDEQITQIDENLKKAQDELNQKTEQYKKDIESSSTAVKDVEQCKLELSSADANIYNLILTLGTGISNADISKIAIADANLASGPDTDKDGLSDDVETVIGTDPAKDDTDGDTFKDKDELLSGFDPIAKGARLPIDQKYADQQKGRIIIQIEGNKDAWYVSPADGKRYFLGHPADGYKAMRSIEFWTKDYKKT